MSQGTFLETLIRLEASKRTFVFRPKIDFLKGYVHGFWPKMKKILKSTFFTCLCP